MTPHQQRVVDEQESLQDKVDKLGNFMQGELFHVVCDSEEQYRLIRQYNAMYAYNGILVERIHAFKEQA